MILTFLVINIALYVFGAGYWLNRPISSFTSLAALANLALACWGAYILKLAILRGFT